MPTWVRLGLLCILWSGCMATKMSLCALCAVSHLCYLCGWLTASLTRIYLRTLGSRISLSSTRHSRTRMHRKPFVRMHADLLNFRCEKQILLTSCNFATSGVSARLRQDDSCWLHGEARA